MGWTELLAWSLRTNGLLCCFPGMSHTPTPRQQQVVIWEATGIAIASRITETVTNLTLNTVQS